MTQAFGPQTTPHIFIFDKARRLRYEGRIDNSYRIEMVKTRDAQNAIDALLANKEVQYAHTGAFGPQPVERRYLLPSTKRRRRLTRRPSPWIWRPLTI